MQDERTRLISPCLKAGALRHILVTIGASIPNIQLIHLGANIANTKEPVTILISGLDLIHEVLHIGHHFNFLRLFCVVSLAVSILYHVKYILSSKNEKNILKQT